MGCPVDKSSQKLADTEILGGYVVNVLCNYHFS